MNIYVARLSFDTTSESLEELFAEYGEVSSANIVRDRETGRSRGFGFVEMANDEEGQAAIDKLNETEFEGRTISVAVARPKEERGNGGGFNRGGGSRGGYGSGNRGGGSRGGYGGGGNRGGYSNDRY